MEPIPPHPVSTGPKPANSVVSWGMRRQLTYLLIFFFLVAGAGYGVYTRITPKPTCSDSLRNGTESGVDCGGSCSRICANEIEDLQVEWSKIFQARSGTYDAAALVLNPNLAYGLATLHYRFSLFDGNNKLVAEREGDTFVNPGEKVALYEPNIVTGDRVPMRAYVQFEDPDYVLSWRKATLPLRPQLSIDNPQFRIAAKPELVAQLANRSIADAASVQAVGILFDKDEAPIGVQSSYFDNLKRNDAVPVSFSWISSEKGGTPTSGQVFPRTTAEGIR